MLVPEAGVVVVLEVVNYWTHQFIFIYSSQSREKYIYPEYHNCKSQDFLTDKGLLYVWLSFSIGTALKWFVWVLTNLELGFSVLETIFGRDRFGFCLSLVLLMLAMEPVYSLFSIFRLNKGSSTSNPAYWNACPCFWAISISRRWLFFRLWLTRWFCSFMTSWKTILQPCSSPSIGLFFRSLCSTPLSLLWLVELLICEWWRFLTWRRESHSSWVSIGKSAWDSLSCLMFLESRWTSAPGTLSSRCWPRICPAETSFSA